MTDNASRFLALLLCLPGMARAGQFVAIDAFASDDADGTQIKKVALEYDFRHADDEHYLGIALQRARFLPLADRWQDDNRAYLRFADTGEKWKWNGQVGSDGHTVLGSASTHNQAPRRQEYFVEREIVETPLGLRRGIYYTYAGAAYDLPLGDRDVVTSVIGVQDFTGHNLRAQYRGNFIHVLAPEQGLSAQLRVRYFHSSDPHEFDYFSPRWYAEAIPTLQMRRFHSGWRYQLAAGYGRQRSDDTQWRSARLVDASITSPVDRQWQFKAAMNYTNTPGNSGYIYDYRQLVLSLGHSF
jgi:hypothetical protein